MAFRDFILRVLPRKWAETAERESRAWKATCVHCGTSTTVWDLGGLRWGKGRPGIAARCQPCGRVRTHRLSRD